MCNFVFDPDLWYKNTDRLVEPQHCNYPALPGYKYCAFHIHPFLLWDNVTSIQNLHQIYKQTIQSIGRIELFCCTIPYLNFQDLKNVVDPNQPINIGYSTFLSPIDLSSTELNNDLSISDCRIPELNLDGAKITGRLHIWDSTVAELRCNKAKILDNSHFANTIFGKADFSNTEFNGAVSFCEEEPEDASIKEVSENTGTDAAEFHVTPSFLGTKFSDIAIFAGVKFHDAAVFSDAKFQIGASFKRVEANVGVHFGSARFHGRVDFGETDLGYAGFTSTHFNDIVVFEDCKFGGLFAPCFTEPISKHVAAEGIQYGSGYIKSSSRAMENPFFSYLASEMQDLSAAFTGSRPDEYFYFENVSATSALDFRHVDFEYLAVSAQINRKRVDAVGLAHGSIESGELIVLDSEKSVYQLEKATVGDVIIGYPDDIGVFDNLYIGDTKFTEFDFSNFRESLINSNWVIDGIRKNGKHTQYEKRETTYAKAKAGAANQGDTYAESKFFIMERRCRRDRYFSEYKNSDSLKKKAAASYKAVSNLLYDASCKYGESPGRVMLISLGSIFAFAMLYWVLQEGISNWSSVSYGVNFDGAIGYLVFSLQAFTSFFLPGNLEPENQLIHLVSSVQSFFGAFAIALFVATLVRTVER